MPKQPNIRWRDKDRKRIAYAVRAFNAKRTRLIKQVPELVDFLPDKQVSKDIQASIHTRAEFNRQLKSLQRFLKPGAEKTISTAGGVKTTVWQKKEASLAVRRINRERAKRAAKADAAKGTQGIVTDWNLQPKADFAWANKERTQEDWKSFLEGVKHQSKDTYWAARDELYRKNYGEAVQQVFGQKEKEEIETIMKYLSSEEIVDGMGFSPRLDIHFIYPEDDLNDQSMTELWNDIIDMWYVYLEKKRGTLISNKAKEDINKIRVGN